MKFTRKFFRPVLLGMALAVSLAGCQQGGGFSSRDPIGPAPAGVPSPGIGAPGGQSIDTRGTGSIAGSEGDASLANPNSPFSTAGRGPR